MTEKIEGALTAEEWSAEAPSPVTDSQWQSVCSAAEMYPRHGLAALALYGQPYGFTWADVELLDRPSDSGVMRDTTSIDDLLRRIVALLPPRPET